jgi:hypothetical protein
MCMILRLVVTGVLLCCSVGAWAQWEISGGRFVDRYQDELKEFYKPGDSYQLAVGVAGRDKDARLALTVNLGFGRYTPKADTFFTFVHNDVLGYQSYSDYKVYPFTLAGRYDFILWNHLELYLGLEWGYHFISYRYATLDRGVEDRDHVVDGRTVLIPSTGVGVAVGRVCFFAQTQFNFSSGESHRGRKDVINFIWSNGIGVRLRFGKIE